MDEPLAHRYLDWLVGQIDCEKNKSYMELFALMHAKEFVWLIPNDDNRIADGLDIRDQFFHRQNALSQGCSVLEVLIGLSRRLTFAAGNTPETWAWQLVTNLELNKMSGHLGRSRIDAVEEILEQLIWRTYYPDGTGGFFPLAWPTEDQRKVEIWYQMSSYIDERPDL